MVQRGSLLQRASRAASRAHAAGRSRPIFLFFKNGEHVDTVEGINAPQIEKFIADFIPEGVIETDEIEGGEEDDVRCRRPCCRRALRRTPRPTRTLA